MKRRTLSLIVAMLGFAVVIAFVIVSANLTQAASATATQTTESTETKVCGTTSGCITAEERRGTRCGKRDSLELVLTLDDCAKEKVYYHIYTKRASNSEWKYSTGGTVYEGRETTEFWCDPPYDYEIREK